MSLLLVPCCMQPRAFGRLRQPRTEAAAQLDGLERAAKAPGMMPLARVLAWFPIGAALLACEPPRSADGAAKPVRPLTVASASVEAATDAQAGSVPAGPAAEDLPPASAEMAEDAVDSNAFTLALLARTKRAGENGLVSGTSVRLALGTTYLGADGLTAREMASTLQLDDDPDLAARLARAELAAWQETRGNAELNVASRVWVDDRWPLRPDFTRRAERGFGAAAASIDYAHPDDARKTINTWVGERTRDKIPELLPKGAVDPQTRLVVTNAVWFKARWEFPFSKGATKDEPFKVDKKKSVTVPLMHLTDEMRVATQDGFKVLEMRYGDSQLAMVVVLPDDANGLAKLESRLTTDMIAKWNAALATARVNVSLPRFTFRSGSALSAILSDMGMKTAFTDRADFTGMAAAQNNERLFINQVFHQTYVAVDELGTEAAAATGTTMRTTSMVTGPIVTFRADHPFLFFIQDAKHGRILFAGRVLNPKA